jgi:hypothetical protein
MRIFCSQTSELMKVHLIGLSCCRIQLNLDLPPAERWVEAGKQYSKLAPGVIAYFKEFLPAWLIPIIADIAADIKVYFPEDYAEEMVGVCSRFRFLML